jgi:hypothetical protein
MIKKLAVIVTAAATLVLATGCNQSVYDSYDHHHVTHHTVIHHHHVTVHHHVYHAPRVKVYRSPRRR